MKTTKSNNIKTLSFEMEVPGEFRINKGLTDSRIQKEMRILSFIILVYSGFIVTEYYLLHNWQYYFFLAISAAVVIYVTQQIKNYNKPL